MDAVPDQQGLAVLAALWPDALPLHVVDVGANPIEGDAPYKRLLAQGHARVTGFEPQPEALARLNAAKSAAETYHPQALGDGKAAELQIYAHSGFTSIFKIRQDVARLIGFQKSTKPVGVLAIETARLDDLTAVGAIDYLKIDVQGSELAIISNGKTKLADAVLIQTEVRFLPLYDGEPSFGALDKEMRRQGFQFHDFDFLKRGALRSASHGTLRPRSNRQVIDGDAFYIRDLTRLRRISDLHLFRLAVLAEAVVKSPNLVLFCLDELARRGRIAATAAQAYLASLSADLRREG